MDRSTRREMEGFFGADLSRVRVHRGPEAAQTARSLGAEAFTMGRDVFFGEGQFDPASRAGKGLLAHELTHVGQQMGLSRKQVDRRPHKGRVADDTEAEAQETERVFLKTPGPAEVGRWAVENYDRRYTSGDEHPISQSEQERLNRISLLALAVAEGQFQNHPLAGQSQTLERVVVSLEVDLTQMSDEEAARLWGDALTAAALAALSGAQGQETIPALPPGPLDLIQMKKAEEGPVKKAEEGPVDTKILLGVAKKTAVSIIGSAASSLKTVLSYARNRPVRWLLGLMIKNPEEFLNRLEKKLLRFLEVIQLIVENAEQIYQALKAALAAKIHQEVEQKAQEALAKQGLGKYAEGIWRYLKPQLTYLRQNWWEVLKKVGWDLLWPFPKTIKDVQEIWRHCVLAEVYFKALLLPMAPSETLKLSRMAWGEVISAWQGGNALLGRYYGWFALASVLVGAIIGAIIGAPAGGIGGVIGFGVGAGIGAKVAGAAGAAMLVSAVLAEVANIIQSHVVLLQGGKEEEEEAYQRIAQSALALGIMGALALLGGLAVHFGKAIVSQAAKFARAAVAKAAGAIGKLRGGKKKAAEPSAPAQEPGKAAEPSAPAQEPESGPRKGEYKPYTQAQVKTFLERLGIRIGPKHAQYKLHPTQEAYQDYYAMLYPDEWALIEAGKKTMPAAYFDIPTGTVHLPPTANIPTVLHEIGHFLCKQSGLSPKMGIYWEEGLVERWATHHGGPEGNLPGQKPKVYYKKNVEFVDDVARIVGEDTLENALAQGQWQPLEAALGKHFGSARGADIFLSFMRKLSAQGEPADLRASAEGMLKLGSRWREGLPGFKVEKQGYSLSAKSGAEGVLGEFWARGLVEWWANRHGGPGRSLNQFPDNVKFVEGVAKVVGDGTLENALAGQWRPLRSALESHFGGAEGAQRFYQLLQKVKANGEPADTWVRAQKMLGLGPRWREALPGA